MKINKDGTIDMRKLSPQEQSFMREQIAMKLKLWNKCPKI
jgi:hypothetical protein